VSLKGHVRGGVEWRALSSIWLRWFCLVPDADAAIQRRISIGE